MQLLDSISLGGNKEINLYQGDLSKIPPSEAVDILVVSAFPGDYIPTPSSLIGALFWKDVSVEDLADDKEIDLRKNFSCWLSKPIQSTNPDIQFKHILCFEPLVRGKPPEVVADIFRALAPLLGDFDSTPSVAMPLVAAGNQGCEVSDILPPLLDAAMHWMSIGFPLKTLKIVTYSDKQSNEAKELFGKFKNANQPSVQTKKLINKYDVFISYAHENRVAMEILCEELLKQDSSIKIFLDKKDINVGASWQKKIFESLDECKKVVVLYSPDYLQSKVCQEEYNIAWARDRNTSEDIDIMFPINLYSSNLPTYMKVKNFVDCREGDYEKIKIASSKLVSELNRELEVN